MRLAIGLEIFNVQEIMKGIQIHLRDNTLRRIEKDPLIDENTFLDNNSIDGLMNFKYFLETLKLVIVIFNVSYFTSIFWIIYCDLIERYMPIWVAHPDQVIPNFLDTYSIYD